MAILQRDLIYSVWLRDREQLWCYQWY